MEHQGRHRLTVKLAALGAFDVRIKDEPPRIDALEQHIRAFGAPSASTVASVMAVGSRGSASVASFSQAANNRNGSSAAVKSPLVNQVGVFYWRCIGHLWGTSRGRCRGDQLPPL